VNLSPGVNVVVGPNNAGKSNLLSGLALLFGERYPRRTDVAHKEFYLHPEQTDPALLLGVAARLVGAEGEVRPGEGWGAYGEGWSPDPTTGEIRDPWSEDWWKALLGAAGPAKGWWGQDVLGDQLGRALAAGELWTYAVCEREEEGELALGLLLKAGEQWFRLTRVRGAVREGLMSAAYLPAFRSPAESLRVTEWSWYGKLVRALYRSEREQKEDDFKHAEQEISSLVHGAFAHPSSRVEQLLSELVPAVKARFKAGPFTADDAHKAVTLFLDDGVDSPHTEKGAGLQSLLVIALFWLYCEHFHKSGTVLLLEEPENHLHPHGRRALVAALRRFVQEDETRRQVIVTTHSENLVRAADVEGLKVVRKRATGSRFWELPRDHQHKGRWQQILRRSQEMVFAEHAILVEGGEEHLVSVIASKLCGAPGILDRCNISVVRVEGKEDFKKHTTLLEALGIGWTILTDRDFLGQGAHHFKDRLPAGALAGTPDDLVNELEHIGIFVNPFGELEDLYTPQGRQLVSELRKDRAALRIAQELEAGSTLAEWFQDLEPVQKVIHHALPQAGAGTGRDDN
jgi:putative ATP-dependent endonuclease of OLD family